MQTRQRVQLATDIRPLRRCRPPGLRLIRLVERSRVGLQIRRNSERRLEARSWEQRLPRAARRLKGMQRPIRVTRCASRRRPPGRLQVRHRNRPRSTGRLVHLADMRGHEVEGQLPIQRLRGTIPGGITTALRTMPPLVQQHRPPQRTRWGWCRHLPKTHSRIPRRVPRPQRVLQRDTARHPRADSLQAIPTARCRAE